MGGAGSDVAGDPLHAVAATLHRHVRIAATLSVRRSRLVRIPSPSFPPRPSCDSRRMAPRVPVMRASATELHVLVQPHDRTFVERIRGIPGSRWNGQVWIIPDRPSTREVLEGRLGARLPPEQRPVPSTAAGTRRSALPTAPRPMSGLRRVWPQAPSDRTPEPPPSTRIGPARPDPGPGRMIPHHVGASLTATLRGPPIPGPDPPCDHEATQLHRPHQADQLPERASSGQPQAHRSAPEARLGPGTRTWPGKPLACCRRRMDDCVRCRSRSSQPARTCPIRARSETGSGDESRLIPATLDL